MKKFALLLAAGSFILAACNNKDFKKTESGIEYRFLKDDKESINASAGDVLLSNLRMSIESNDSLLMETFSTNSLQYLPYEEPSLKQIFSLLSKGDSVEFFINADTLFQKTFGMPTPPWIASGERIRFIMAVSDILNQEQLETKNKEQLESMRMEDEQSLKAYLEKQPNVKTTESGLMYIVVKEGKGKAPKRGDQVSMLYTGYFTNEDVFDENQSKDEPFKFSVGLGQVIPGWDEGVLLMKEGAQYKFIIPWNLAYGESGSGPIMPFSSLVFDVELLKVN
jgi:FKBP-type peptidyl-prolyl cis-trans isomerase FkpA